MFFRKKVEAKVSKKEKSEKYLREVWSAEEFYKGLKDGKKEIGSLLFSKHSTEEKIIKQICRYTGYKYLGRKDILCQHTQASNKFYVTHYMVR